MPFRQAVGEVPVCRVKNLENTATDENPLAAATLATGSDVVDRRLFTHLSRALSMASMIVSPRN